MNVHNYQDHKPQNRFVRSTNLALLAGLYKPLRKYTTLLISAGLSAGRQDFRNDSFSIFRQQRWYAGVPLQAGIMFGGKLLGAGANLYANLNKYPEYGIQLQFHFGRLRSSKRLRDAGDGG